MHPGFPSGFSLFFWPVPHGLRDLGSPTRDGTPGLAVKGPNPNHWVTREVLPAFSLKGLHSGPWELAEHNYIFKTKDWGPVFPMSLAVSKVFPMSLAVRKVLLPLLSGGTEGKERNALQLIDMFPYEQSELWLYYWRHTTCPMICGH